MKKNNTILYIISASIFGIGLYLKSKYKSNKKNEDGELNFVSENKSGVKKVLFIGDSVTADPNYSYPALIKKKRKDVIVEVLAKGGMQTSWMLKNLPSKLNSNKYDSVFIYGGINDAFGSIKTDKIVSNVQQMVDLAKSKGSKVFIILGYEPNKFMDYKKIPTTQYVRIKEGYLPLIENYKKLQNAYSSKLNGVKLIPKIDLGTLNSDGVHPNLKGQTILAENINKYI